jgi:hypothetical protein
MIKNLKCQFCVEERADTTSLKSEYFLIVIDSDGRKFEIQELKPIGEIKGAISGIIWDKNEKRYNLEWRLAKSRLQLIVFEIVGAISISISVIILVIYFMKKVMEFGG